MDLKPINLHLNFGQKVFMQDKIDWESFPWRNVSWEYEITYEQLYQNFRARLMDELAKELLGNGSEGL